RLYLFGQYSPTCCPEYLKEENFAILKNRVDRIETHNKSLLDFLNDTHYPIHKVTLLDHMDWLYQNHYDILKNQWESLIRRSQDTTKIIWRSASLEVDFINPIRFSCGRFLGDILKYNTSLAHELHQKDRVHTYGSFYVTEVMA
ncbi:MAG: DUF3419 family protein, partial [Pseudomonadota bacterium]